MCASFFAACAGSQKAVLPKAREDASSHSHVIYAHANEHPIHPEPYAGKMHDGYVPRHVHLPEAEGPHVSLADHLRSINAALNGAAQRSRMDVQTGNDTSGQGGYYLKTPQNLPYSGLGNGAIWSAQDAVPPDGYYNVNLPAPPPCIPGDACGNYLYAPTTHGPNGNCIEVASDYQDVSGEYG